MNLNDFVVVPNKPSSMKLKARGAREMRLETVKLAQESEVLEDRLRELRECMIREKEERKKSGMFHWKSGEAGTLTAHSGKVSKYKENNFEKLSAGKMKIRALKDEPDEVQHTPAEKQPRPSRKDQMSSRRPRLKGKACGQCETRTAGLMCSECGEDYCVGCFARFHQKGALKHHRMIPIQMEIQTSISTLDVVSQFKRQIDPEESPARSRQKGTPQGGRILGGDSHPDAQIVIVNHEEESEEEEEEDDWQGLDLRGQSSSPLSQEFNEEKSAGSFQEALREWKGESGNAKCDPERAWRPTEALPGPTEGTGTQAGLSQKRTPIEVVFREHSLSYMEKLLVKKHRRTPIEDYRPLSSAGSSQESLMDLNRLTDEEGPSLTAGETEVRRYCASLFAPAAAAAAEATSGSCIPLDCSTQSCLSAVELDKVAGDSKPNSAFTTELRIDDANINQPEETVAIALQNVRHVKTEENEGLEALEIPVRVPTQTPHLTSACSKRPPRSTPPKVPSPQPDQSSNTGTPASQPPRPHLSPEILSTRSQRPSMSSAAALKPGSSRPPPFSQSLRPPQITPQRSANLELSPCQGDSSDKETGARGSLRGRDPGEERGAPCTTRSFPPAGPLTPGPAPALGSHSDPEHEPQAAARPGQLLPPSNALHSLAQREITQFNHYSGLSGFFTLGLERAQPNPPPLRGTQETEDSTGSLSEGLKYWRPDSSLRVGADEQLLGEQDNSRNSQTSSLSCKATRATPSVQRLQSSGGNRPRVGSGSATPRPACSVSADERPLSQPRSQAAQEILEIECLDSTRGEDPLLEDEADCFTLSSLEEELRWMNGEQGAALPIPTAPFPFPHQRGGVRCHYRRTSSALREAGDGLVDEEEEEEEEVRRDKLNVASLL